MAQKIDITLIDDLDGTPATKTHRFSLNGSSYSIDLSDKNGNALEKALAKFIEAGRKGGGSGKGATRTRRPVDYPVAEVRAWAIEQGMTVPTRGRLKPEVVEAWRNKK